MNEIEALIKSNELLSSEVLHLRQLVHFQGAQIEALRVYAVAKIADLNKEDRKAAFDHVAKITRAAYDEAISKIESKFPAIAADIDLRSGLSKEDQELWYLASEEFPKQDESEDGASEGQKD